MAAVATGESRVKNETAADSRRASGNPRPCCHGDPRAAEYSKFGSQTTARRAQLTALRPRVAGRLFAWSERSDDCIGRSRDICTVPAVARPVNARSAHVMFLSDALEVLLDLAPRQPQHHRPAVRADGRIRRRAQLVEDVRHLLVGQRVVRLHRRMARRRRGDALQRLLHLRAAIEPFEILGQRAQRLRRSPRSSSSAGTAVTLIVVAAERLDLEAEALELGGATDQRLLRRRRRARAASAPAAAAISSGPPSAAPSTRSNSTRSCATC